MDVSIVIRAKNEAASIGEALSRIESQAFDGHYEIIVVDSGSSDGTLDIVRKHNARLIEIPQEEFSYGRALNIGIDQAKGKFIVILSAHCFPRDGSWLTSLTSDFQRADVAGIYGRQLSVGRLNPFEACRNELFFGPEKMMFRANKKAMMGRLHFSNSNAAIRRTVWEKFKFDDDAPWAEDILWQKQVTEAGFTIAYAPDAAVYHTHKVNIYNAFRISKDCSLTLASMNRKRQSVPTAIFDIAVFLYLLSGAMFQNMRYVWENNHHQFLGIAPLYVTSECAGWLAGRIKYRLGKRGMAKDQCVGERCSGEPWKKRKNE